MSVAGLVLAAGAGTRLGTPKALVDLGGRSLLDRAVATLREGGCDPVLAVLPPGLPVPTGVDAVPNPAWRTGMGSSLRLGLSRLTSDAVVVLLVDTPLVGPGAVRRLASAHAAGAGVAVATYAGRRGHPVLLAREHWEEVARLAVGDGGARAFLAAHPSLVTEVACDGTGDPADVDTPEDLARVRAALSGAPPGAGVSGAGDQRGDSSTPDV